MHLNSISDGSADSAWGVCFPPSSTHSFAHLGRDAQKSLETAEPYPGFPVSTSLSYSRWPESTACLIVLCEIEMASAPEWKLWLIDGSCVTRRRTVLSQEKPSDFHQEGFSWPLVLSYGLHAFVFPLSLTLKHFLDLTCFTFSSVAVVPVLVPGQRLPTVFDSWCAQVQELMKCVWLIYYRALPQVKTVLLCGKFFLFKRRSLFLRVELWF